MKPCYLCFNLDFHKILITVYTTIHCNVKRKLVYLFESLPQLRHLSILEFVSTDVHLEYRQKQTRIVKIVTEAGEKILAEISKNFI